MRTAHSSAERKRKDKVACYITKFGRAFMCPEPVLDFF